MKMMVCIVSVECMSERLKRVSIEVRAPSSNLCS